MITINDPEAERAIREEAQRTGEPPSAVARWAVLRGLADRRARRRATEHDVQPGPQAPTPDEVEARLARLRVLHERIGALPILDTRPDDEIVGYDESGLPC